MLSFAFQRFFVRILIRRARRPLILRYFGNFLNGFKFHKNSLMKQITNASFHTPHSSIRTLLSNLHFIHVETRDSSVSTVLGYGPNDSGLDFRQGEEISLLYKMSGPTLQPTQLPIKRLPGVLYPQVKRPGIEVNHSAPSSTDFKNEWCCTSAFPQYPHGVVRDNFGCLITHSFRL
jgi:hypothetical protein